MKVPVSVIILTFNEEVNIRECLDSVVDFTDSIFVVDSGSTDNTLAILNEYPVTVINHPFENYSQQRNWAIKNLAVSDWILNLDADHRLTPEFKNDLRKHFGTGVPDTVNGFMASRKTMFMGKWIRYGGHYPTYHAIMFRKDKGYCEEKLYDQHFVIEGAALQVKGDIIDLITDSLSSFTARHNKWSSLEAEEQFNASRRKNPSTIQGNLTGNPIEKRRYIKNIYERFPLFVRPVIYFIVRYFFRLGFLDGKQGLVFHFLQCFWFRFLVDAKIYELRKRGRHEL